MTVPPTKESGASAECKRLRGPDATGPDCGCREPACSLAAIRRDPSGTWVSVIPSSWFPDLEVCPE